MFYSQCLDLFNTIVNSNEDNAIFLKEQLYNETGIISNDIKVIFNKDNETSLSVNDIIFIIIYLCSLIAIVIAVLCFLIQFFFLFEDSASITNNNEYGSYSSSFASSNSFYGTPYNKLQQEQDSIFDSHHQRKASFNKHSNLHYCNYIILKLSNKFSITKNMKLLFTISNKYYIDKNIEIFSFIRFIIMCFLSLYNNAGMLSILPPMNMTYKGFYQSLKLIIIKTNLV